MSGKPTQNDLILASLKRGTRLTPIDALRDFGCFRLAARICDLRAEGHHIEQRKLHKNGKYFAVYWMP